MLRIAAAAAVLAGARADTCFEAASQLSEFAYECQTEMSSDFTLHYTANATTGTVSFAGEFASSGGWHGCGLSTLETMYTADIVVHDQSSLDKYTTSGFSFPSSASSSVAYSDLQANVLTGPDRTVLRWESALDTGSVDIDLDGSNYVVYAFGANDSPLYHSGNRAVQSVQWFAGAGDDDDDDDGGSDDGSDDSGSCTTSTIAGYVCQASLSSDFTLHWTMGAETLAMAGQFEGKSDGWASFGIAAGAAMDDSDVVASTDAWGVDMFHLSEYDFPSSVDASQSAVVAPTATQESGDLLLEWAREYDNGGAVAISTSGDNYVLFAEGGASDPSYHGSGGRGIVLLNFATGETSAVPVNADKVAHGVLMTLGWGLCLPLGVTIARHADRSKGPLWFRLHRALQTMGLLLATVGVVIAMNKLGPMDTGHGAIGMVVMAIGWLQPLNAFVRPHPKNEDGTVPRHRRAWEILHRGLGRVAVALALLNILIGCSLFKDQEGEVGEWKALWFYNLVFVATWGIGMLVLEMLEVRGRSSRVLALNP